ncbi:DNA ligase [Capsaspora owczarzaki ATCC 30864]|uniref:DNA ligase n=2 Tax=Capsaspora owczarzaki (strain ATCC 30864) TaxID=595528 RepID=A0A0D2WMT9_CAPO3|nr:DNA ligase [Capsaspora owczarzaki ATCC 30864]
MVVDAPAAAAAAAADDGTDVEDDATDADDSDAGHSSGSDAFVSESLQLDNWDDDTASSSTAAALSSSSAAPAAAAAAAAPADEPTDDRPQCQYGAACYRRNAKHNAQFSHPKLLTASPAKPPAQASASSGKRAHSEDEADGGADTKPDAASATAATTAAAAGAGARKRLKMDQFSDDDIDDAAAGQASKVVETTESLERQAPRDMQEGDSIEIAGAGARNYFLKLIGGVYSCTCPAWRNQSKAINARTCKHVIAMRGQEAEDARLAEAEQAGGDADDDDGGDARSGKRRATSRPSKPPTSSYTVAPDLLLAHKWSPDLAVDFKGWFISEKWDGVRAYWDGSKFVSRLGNTFHAPKWFTQGLPTDCTLDGELWCGRNKFQQTVSIVRRSDMSSDWQRVKYLVFDIPSLKKPFEKRIEHLTQVVLPAANGSTYLEIVDHVPCKGDDHIKKELQRVEALGGEGLMLRKPGSMYEGRRSMTLLKVKSFEDADAKVIGHNQGSGRHQGRLGALVCILADGTQFNCGSGLSDQQRNKPPPIGSVVIVRYQELTAGKVPRFPVFVGVRADAVWPPQA